MFHLADISMFTFPYVRLLIVGLSGFLAVYNSRQCGCVSSQPTKKLENTLLPTLAL